MVSSRIQQKIDEILTDIKAVIEICKKEELTNEQWFINFEDELNKYSGVDYSVTPIDIDLLPEGTAEERLNQWLNYKNTGIQHN